MSHATFATSFAPVLDRRVVDGVRHGLVAVQGAVQAGAVFLGASLTFAAVMWLLLAGPGLLADGAGTGVARQHASHFSRYTHTIRL